MTIGQRIKQRRKELNLSVDDIAIKLGKNRATIYRYENDDIENLPTTILEPLAKALETTPAYLMGWHSIEDKIPSARNLITLLENCPETIILELSKMCRIARIENNLTEKYIALEANISLEDYLAFENEGSAIGAASIMRIISILGLDTPYTEGIIMGDLLHSYNNIGINDLIDQFDLNESAKSVLKTFINASDDLQEEILKTLKESLKDLN